MKMEDLKKIVIGLVAAAALPIITGLIVRILVWLVLLGYNLIP